MRLSYYLNPLRLLPVFFFFTAVNSSLGSVTISNDTTFSGTINITTDVFITNASTLTIQAGAVLNMSFGVSIKAERQCHIIIQGTNANKVFIRSNTPGKYWGSLYTKGDSSSVEIHFADIQEGQVLAYDSSTMLIQDSYLHDYLMMPTKNIAYSNNADSVTLQRCHISNYWQVNFVNTPTLIDNCLLEYIYEDGIDLDNSPGAIISNCTIRNGLCEPGKIHSVDAIDFGVVNVGEQGSIGEVQNCLVYNITDKGVSMGEKCRHIIVTGSVFYNCGSGSTVKDSSVAEIYNNTIVNCDFGIECVEKNIGLGGGHATGYNNILWNNTSSVYLDNGGTLSLTYSDITFSGIFPGTGNINSYPLFADTLNLNYRLLTGSPCIGSGLSGANMGAIFPVGASISEPINYINIGIPHSSEIIAGDSLYSISWLCGDSIHFVNLEFSSDNGLTWTTIGQHIDAQSGSFLWTVPNIYSSKCFIKVSDESDTLIASTQNLPFAITPVGVKSSLPSFSYPAGYYNNSLSLDLNADTGTTIYYTLDGSEPTDQSLQYTQAINLTQQNIPSGYTEQNITATNPPQFPLSAIRTAPTSQIGPNPALWYMPVGAIDKIAVVRARSYTSGLGLSDVVTNSYLINTNGMLNPAQLPVISLSTDKENFFDYNNGIYIPGAKFTGYSFTGNYEMTGSESERPVNFEYFEPGQPRALTLNAGVRVRGEWIRSLGEKALSVFARAEYDSINYFNHEFFPGYKTMPYRGSLMNTFKRIILRNDGNNWGWFQTTMMKDDVVQSLFDHLNLKYQASRPSIVFLDGEYWGIHNIRELPDEKNMGLTYDINPDNITIVENNLDGHNLLQAGSETDLADYLSLKDYIAQNDLNIPAVYDYVKSKMDVINFADHWIATIYANKENFEHNTGWWKMTGGTTAQTSYGHDGRWRWFAYDFDYSFASSSFRMLPFINGFDATNDFLLTRMLTCNEFHNYFINRAADLLNSSFIPSRTVSRVAAYANVIRPEITRHSNRWRTPASISYWQQGIDTIINFAQQRTPFVFDDFTSTFTLAGTTQLLVNVNDSAMGKVCVNTITIEQSLPGVNTSLYPWSGKYFLNLSFPLVAIPKTGYRFVRWNETGLTEDTISVTLTGDSMFTAVFEFDSTWFPPVYPQLYINEVVASNSTTLDNYGEADDWIELFNPNDTVVDLSGYYLSDRGEFLTKHLFAASDSTKIPAHGFLLLFADNETNEGVRHVAFNLSASGEGVFLTAPDEITIIDSVSFGLMVMDTSYGRSPDGSSNWIYFSNTTPGASNIHIGIDEITANAFLIYPNPLTNGILHFSEAISFHLYNNLGMEICGKKNVSETDLSLLPKGIYLLRTENGFVAKVLKVN